MSLKVKTFCKINYKLIIILFFIFCSTLLPESDVEYTDYSPSVTQSDEEVDKIESTQTQPSEKPRKIRKIIIEGNKHLNSSAIIAKLPYHENNIFDPELSSEAIGHIYSLGFFNQVIIESENIGEDQIDLYFTLKENPLLEKVEFVGNKSIKKKKFIERLNLDKVETFNQEHLDQSISIIKSMYENEGFYHSKISGEIIRDKKTPDKVSVKFNIVENVKSRVIRIDFRGNKTIPGRKLKRIIHTKEAWVLGVLTGAGKYIPDVVDIDKRMIERYYQDSGYLLAKVTNVDVKFSRNEKDIHLTYNVEEGKCFTVRKISAPGDEIFLESELLKHISVEEGKHYNAGNVAMSIEKLKSLWGEKGYINADVYPQIMPDETTNEVDITFYAERGKKIYVNRIEISGNEYTKDKVIRHSIDIEEGDLLTTKKLAHSENDVERLSYFERGGVNWKIHRINDELVDLEMNVKETKTGHLAFNVSVGSQENSNKRAMRAGVTMDKNNWMGTGVDVGLQTSIQLAKDGSQVYEGHIVDRHLFDTDIIGALSGYHRKEDFDEWVDVTTAPEITESGAIAKLGFLPIPKIDKHVQADFVVGYEYLNSNAPNARLEGESLTDHQMRQSGKLWARGGTPKENAALQIILDDAFMSSGIQWFSLNFEKDTRNHMIYPSRGHRLAWDNKLALPGINKHYAFIKTVLEASYYTPLIEEDKLVLMLHAKLGTVRALGQAKDIPYKELFHIGSQTTVRGFRFGSIGPAWRNRDPLGGRNALIFNAELIFPLIPDYSMKGHVFYDAGAGWSTPKRGTTMPSLITRNNFNIRQSVGFGFNLLAPQPIKIDWGYKLDKRPGESAHELHLNANFAF